MSEPINYDRGVLIRRDVTTGAKVFMYADEPGVFRNAHGTEVTPELAASAGFDTERLLKEKLKRQRMTEAQKQIEEEFNSVSQREVVKEKNGFKVVHLGLERYDVLDPDDQKLNLAGPLPLAVAEKLLSSMAPGKVEKKD